MQRKRVQACTCVCMCVSEREREAGCRVCASLLWASAFCASLRWSWCSLCACFACLPVNTQLGVQREGRCGSALRKAVEFVRVSVTEAVFGFVYALCSGPEVPPPPLRFQRRLKCGPPPPPSSLITVGGDAASLFKYQKHDVAAAAVHKLSHTRSSVQLLGHCVENVYQSLH